VKIVEPPIIVSVCLETQRRINWARARSADREVAPDQPKARVPGEPPRQPSRGNPDGT
jgi:hypothetical protein